MTKSLLFDEVIEDATATMCKVKQKALKEWNS